MTLNRWVQRASSSNQQQPTPRKFRHKEKHDVPNIISESFVAETDNLRILEFQKWTTGGAFNHVKYGDRIHKLPLIDFDAQSLIFDFRTECSQSKATLTRDTILAI